MLHGGGEQPAADASSRLAEAATSVQEEPAAELQGAGSAAEAQGPARVINAAASSQSAAASPPAPAAAGPEVTSFAPQTPEVPQTEALPPSNARPAPGPQASQASDAQPAEQGPLEYVSRDNRTPHMERKLRNMQVGPRSRFCCACAAAHNIWDDIESSCNR